MHKNSNIAICVAPLQLEAVGCDQQLSTLSDTTRRHEQSRQRRIQELRWTFKSQACAELRICLCTLGSLQAPGLPEDVACQAGPVLGVKALIRGLMASALIRPR